MNPPPGYDVLEDDSPGYGHIRRLARAVLDYLTSQRRVEFTANILCRGPEYMIRIRPTHARDNQGLMAELVGGVADSEAMIEIFGIRAAAAMQADDILELWNREALPSSEGA